MSKEQTSFMGAIASICPVCKEPFLYYREHHVYKRLSGTHQIFFCKYSCMLKFDRTLDKSIFDLKNKKGE